METRNTNRKIKCPRCGKMKLSIKEMWADNSIEYMYQDGEIEKDGNIETGYPYKVAASCCDCGHEWTIRGIVQVAQL